MEPRKAPPSVLLKALHGELKGRVFSFPARDCVLLGRAPDAAVRVPDDPFVSRHHLLMETETSSILLSDLGSRNGFFVNDRHFGREESSSSTFAGDGDMIAMGTNRFQLQVETAGRDIQGQAGCPSSEHPPAAGSTPFFPDEPPAENIPGHFQIIREIGRSWVGVRYQAIDQRSGQPVTLKVIIPDGDFSEEGAEIAVRELGRLQGLRHPCLTGLKEYGWRGNGFFCAQEEIEGTDLARYLKMRGGRLPLAEAAPIMLDILEGLTHAWGNGNILHRNLKPANILVRGEGQGIHAVVADCGLFRALETAGLNRTIRSRLYFEAPAWWPRERITFFTRADPASEVFSAAAVFYQMLTGYLVRDGMFELQSQAAWAKRAPGLPEYLSLMAGHPPVPIRERDPGIPAELAEILDKALAEPVIRRGEEHPGSVLAEARFSDPGSFLGALREVLPGIVSTPSVSGKAV